MKLCISTVLASVLALGLAASPASADSITIDSTNCSDDCFGLAWTLTINSGTFMDGSDSYAYEAILDVTDDPLVAGVPDERISAVDFKVSSSLLDGVLVSFPTNSGNWDTGVNVMNSAGCTGPEAGFLCSDTATDPAETSGGPLQWQWYFNTNDPIFTGLEGAHIGAKLTYLNRPGKLLSEEFHSVPEPSTLSLLIPGLGLVAARAWRRRKGGRP